MSLIKSSHQRLRVLNRLSSHFVAFSDAVGRKFSRMGKWGPLQVFVTLCMSHSESSSKSGISWEESINLVHAGPAGEAFGWGEMTAAPTKRSFFDARKKLNALGDRFVWDHLLSTMHGKDLPTRTEIGGFGFLHGDGSQFYVQRSEETIREFGVQDNGTSSTTHYPQGKVVVLMEGGSGRLIDYQLVRCKDKKNAGESSILFEEKEAIRHFVDQMTPKDCLVWDSGGSSHQLFYDMHSAGKHFLMAIRNSWNLSKRMKASGKADMLLDYDIPAACLPPGAAKKQATIKLRVVRIRDGNGDGKILVTNIVEGLTRSHIRKVYKQRWAVETLFRHAKEYLGMRILRSKTLWGIKQEALAVLAILHMSAHINDHVTRAANRVYSPLCCLKAGFRRPRIGHLLDLAMNLLATHCGPEKPRLKRSTLNLWANMLQNPYIVEPGRSAERISRLPFGLFLPKRDGKTQRIAAKKRAAA